MAVAYSEGHRLSNLQRCRHSVRSRPRNNQTALVGLWASSQLPPLPGKDFIADVRQVSMTVSNGLEADVAESPLSGRICTLWDIGCQLPYKSQIVNHSRKRPIGQPGGLSRRYGGERSARTSGPTGEIPMKSTLKIASVLLLMASSAAFASGQTTAPATTPVPATHSTMTAPPATTPAATAAAPMAESKADIKAEKKQIRADKKAALAACKSMKGAEKSACKKEAAAKETAAMAELKSRK